MKKLCKGLGITIFIIGFSLAFVFISLFVCKKIMDATELSVLKGGLEILDASAYREEWQNTPSDIAGMTKWDKYKAGLVVASGSDTDADGITDKEELEVYGSNPLKLSTAGDLYSDLYKVNHGMNLQQYYEYVGAEEFPYNEVSKVILKAELPTDFNAVITDATGRSNEGENTVYAEYDVYNYGGKLAIDLSEIMEEHDIEVSDIAIFVSDGKDTKQYSYSGDGSVITLKKNLEATKSYTVYVMEKGFGNSIAMRFGSIRTREESMEEDVTGEALFMNFPALTVYFGKPADIYYEKFASDQKTEKLKEKVIAHIKTVMGDFDQFFRDDKTIATNKFEINLRYEILKKLLPFCDITYVENGKWDFAQYIFCYYSYSHKVAFEEQKEAEEKASESISGFNYLVDTLPFGNFESEYGVTGNCAGFSHLTAYLYNNGYYESSGRYKTQEGIITWDISNDAGNTTLTDRGLADYKTASFVIDNSENKRILSEMLSSGEKQFVRMMGAINAEGNDRANFIYNEVYGGENGRLVYDYSLIESMKAYLDQGKILDVYFMMVDGTGHAVNIYGYENDDTDADVTWFYVYDCNFPQNDTGASVISETGMKLRVEKRRKASGDGFTFAYDYFPLQIEGYGATSNSSITENSFMIVMDENWRILND